jgi:hypothetical protein
VTKIVVNTAVDTTIVVCMDVDGSRFHILIALKAENKAIKLTVEMLTASHKTSNFTLIFRHVWTNIFFGG